MRVDGRRLCRGPVLRRVLRRLPCALLALGLTVALVSTGVLVTRRAQELAGRGAVEQPGLDAAYAQAPDDPVSGVEPVRPARFAINLTYTSLDAPDDGSAVARVMWDDAWFAADEDAYNHELAQTSSVLAALAYAESGYYQARGDHPPYMENALASLGFGEVSTESYRYRSKVVDEVLDLATGDADGAAYTIARKRLDSGDGDPARDLILVSARGSYGSEWLSNLDLSRDEGGDHGGYVRAAREIGAEVVSWAEESRARGAEVSVLLVGHSRGGAIANLVAAELDDRRAQAGAAASFGPVYAYTFAAPATTLALDARSERYGNIFNIANPSDIMPYLPLSAWGYGRYGVDLDLPSVGRADFDRLDSEMRAVYRASVGVECAADAADVLIVRVACDDIAAAVGSAEELVTPAGAFTALRLLATHVDPVRVLYSHYPSTYIAWLSVIDESQMGTGANRGML